MNAVKPDLAATVRSTELRRDAGGVVRHGAEWLLLWADPDSLRDAAEQAEAARAARAAAAARQALAGALRAVAGRAVAVAFRAGAPALEAGGAALPPDLPPAAARGAADALAVTLALHDPALHRRLAPAGAARGLFDALEQVRCEVLGARHRPGLLANLAAWSEWSLEARGLANARLAADLPVEAAMAVVMRQRLAAQPASALPSLGLGLWDRWVGRHLAAATAGLLAGLHDQAAYAAAAVEFCAALQRSLDRDAPAPPSPPPPPPAPEAEPDAALRPRVAQPAPGAEDDAAVAPRAGATAVAVRPYAAFTTAHDRVLTAADLATPAELAALRVRLDAEAGALRGLLVRLANQLQRRLLARQLRTWDFDLEDGLLDCARLDRVVTTPAAALAFKRERPARARDTVVALLIDCSGSMRGRAILLAAIAADVTARALERSGIACEVLGFTTADWSGGASTADWVRAGRPAAPGRLGDLRHIVFKPADMPCRRSRDAVAAMLLAGLLRENVDGEALAWAHQRLLARAEQRRVLVVISDGAPAEAATLKANPPGLLTAHLDTTIAAIEAAGAVELRAIGIRHDVSRHYRQAITLSDAEMVGPALIGQLARLFEGGR